MPSTLAGFLQEEAIEVIESEEVLEASTQVEVVIFSSSVKTERLISRFSTIASITRSHAAKLSRDETNLMLPRMYSCCARVIFCFSQSLTRDDRRFASAFLRACSLLS